MSGVLGIIAEYDPFHLGHKYHMEEALSKTDADVTVCVISGDFTQRGEPAIADKWARAEMALKQGADLICELPFVFACNNAGYFAKGGVEILEALGADFISFGSETADVEALLEAAESRKNLTEAQEEEIRAYVKKGYSYPRALGEVLGESAERGPNDTLAVEYIRHMKSAKPVPVLRKGAGHGELLEEEEMASATLIRQKILEYGTISCVHSMIPESTADILLRERTRGEFADPEMLLPFLQARAAVLSADELNSVYGAEEGLGSKLKENFRYADSYEKLIESLKSKRYTRTRIQRVLVHTLLGLTRDDVINAKNYIRILGFSAKGAEHLRNLKKSGGPGLPLIENIKKDLNEHPELAGTFSLDVAASDLYNTMCQRDLYINSEYVKKPLKSQAE